MPAKPKVNKFIQKAHIQKGSLHKNVGYPETHKFTPDELKEILAKAKTGGKFHGHAVTDHIRRQAQFAYNIRKK